MTADPLPQLLEPQKTSAVSPWAASAYLFAGNVLPSIGIMVVISGVVEPPQWQTTEIHDRMIFLLMPSAGAVFCPFLIYSVACLTLAVFHVKAAARHFVVRLGLYTGIIVALHYCIIAGILTLHISGLRGEVTIAILSILIGLTCIGVALLLCFICIAADWIWKKAQKIMQTRLGLLVAMFTFPAAAIVLGFVLSAETVASLLSIAVLYALIAAVAFTPGWFLTANISMSIRVFRFRDAPFQFRLWHLIAWISWICAYLAAWRFAVKNALEAYAALPSTPPSSSCYVATAATRGHQSLVRWQAVQGPNGETYRVNMQLSYLKCGEIVLQSSAPRFHGLLRSIYDRIAPPLSRRLNNPWAADAAYLSLLPIEWMTRITLSIIAPDAHRIAGALYRKCD